MTYNEGAGGLGHLGNPNESAAGWVGGCCFVKVITMLFQFGGAKNFI